jgi:hypothetical protein
VYVQFVQPRVAGSGVWIQQPPTPATPGSTTRGIDPDHTNPSLHPPTPVHRTSPFPPLSNTTTGLCDMGARYLVGSISHDEDP